jgi:hypothetical protein
MALIYLRANFPDIAWRVLVMTADSNPIVYRNWKAGGQHIQRTNGAGIWQLYARTRSNTKESVEMKGVMENPRLSR